MSESPTAAPTFQGVEIEFFVILEQQISQSEISGVCNGLQDILAANQTTSNPFYNENLTCTYVANLNRLSLTTNTNANQREWMAEQTFTVSEIIDNDVTFKVKSSGLTVLTSAPESEDKSNNLLMYIGIVVAILFVIMVAALLWKDSKF